MPNSFEGEQIVVYSSWNKFLLNCTKSCMTSQDNTSNWMLHEKKTTVVKFWVFGKSVYSLGREEGLIKSPLKPTRTTLRTSLGFSSALTEQDSQLIYAVTTFWQSRRPLPLQELVSLSSKAAGHVHPGGWLYSAAVCFTAHRPMED